MNKTGDNPVCNETTGAIVLPLSVFCTGDIGAVDAASWDACAADHDPFTSHAYLHALEKSGVTTPDAGWFPQHLIARDATGRMTAAAPVYLKTHSDGEYWSDHGWAQAYRQAGGRYYPKLLLGVPFSPVNGRRLLIRSGAPDLIARTVIDILEQMGRQLGVSSIHAIFPDETDSRRLRAAGWLERHDIQYEWVNNGYRNFDDFLNALSSRKRKQIRRYREIVLNSGVQFRTIPGDQIRPAEWSAFLHLFDEHHRRHQTKQFLTPDFFGQLSDTMGRRLLLSFAVDNGVTVAAMLTVLGDRRIYLRHWGCVPQRRFLHFEMGCHQPIEYAITHGYDAVEGGYGGDHKFARGMRPKLSRSLHWFRHKNMHDAVEASLQQEKDEVARRLAFLNSRSPYK
jgi:uncharacterized protein